MIGFPATVHRLVDAQPFPLLFVTISGAHLYGFPSPDSDFDVRGVHVLPAEQVLGLDSGKETIEKSGLYDGLELDLVTHDVKKFMLLLLKKDGSALEQLYSPLVLKTSPEHDELKTLGAGCLTNHHAHHYLGFAQTQWKLFEKETPRRVKPLLYVFRVLLTGIHLMRAGEVEANLVHLNDIYRLPYVPPLITRKLAGPEQAVLDDREFETYEAEYHRLEQVLRDAQLASRLPDHPSTRQALSDLLVRLRRKTI